MADIDIGRSIFEYGQTYVALSRIRSLDGLFLSEFYPQRIKANPTVIAFYESFPNISPEQMNAYIEQQRLLPITTNVFSNFNYVDASSVKNIKVVSW